MIQFLALYRTGNIVVDVIIVLVLATVAWWVLGYLNAPEIFRRILVVVVVVGIALMVIFGLTGCGVTLRTPYGTASYDAPARVGDGKTALR